MHSLVSFLDLQGNIRSFLLQSLQSGDDRIIIQNLALGVIQDLQQVFLQLSQPQLEFS